MVRTDFLLQHTEKLILLLQVSTHSYVLPGAQEIKQVLLEGMMMLRLQR